MRRKRTEVAAPPAKFYPGEQVVLTAPDHAPDEYVQLNGKPALVLTRDFTGPPGYAIHNLPRDEASWLYGVHIAQLDATGLWPEDWLQPLDATTIARPAAPTGADRGPPYQRRA